MDPSQIMTALEVSERRKKARSEVMHYSPEDLDEGWEFKVVRGGFDAFHSPESMRRLADEESRAGWIMLEKLDDSRVRFKRPAAARDTDDLLQYGVDPYRTDLAPASAWWVLLLVVAVVGGFALILAGFAGR